MKLTGEISFSFISKGIESLHPSLSASGLTENAQLIFDIIHKDDLQTVQQSIQQSFLTLTTWNIEYRVVGHNNKITWFWANANPERKSNGTVIWYGNFEDITDRKEYIKGLEGILFDISHVIRKPVTTMIGLTNAMQTKDIDADRLQKCVEYIKTVAVEMDDYTRKLTEKYFELSVNFRSKVPN
ncbi:MAG: PAS domain-containing protein [Ferruginibacter sp.]